MKFYVYCLAEKIDGPDTRSGGVSGAKVEIIELEGFSVLVSPVEGEPALATRENALSHDSVIRSVLDVTTPLPFRFGTVVTKEQLTGYLKGRRSSIDERLGLVRGCLEMSVKIIGDTDQASLEAEDVNLGPGARFLKEKRREILGGEQRAAQARAVAAWLHDEVGETIRQEQVSLCPTEKLMVAAAHLVPRERLSDYRDRAGKARKMRPELHFLLSGPWPPYSFSNIDLEFKTRFGVS